MNNTGRTVVFLSYGRKGRRCDIMKSGLIILLILDVIKSGKTEIRHHQQDKYPARETNDTTFPWSTTTLFTDLTRKVSDASRFDRMNDGTATWLEKFTDVDDESSSSSVENRPTESPTTESPEKVRGKKRKNLSEWKTRSNENLETFDSEPERSQVRGGGHIPDRFPSSGGGTSTRTRVTSRNSVPDEWTNGLRFESFNRDVLNLEVFGDPVTRKTAAGGNCVETVLEDFVVADHVVGQKVLTDKRELEKIAEEMTQGDKRDLEKVTNTLEKFMEKHSAVSSISLTAVKASERSRTSQTIYRRGKDLVVERREERDENRQPKYLGEGRNSWTRIFKNCLTNSWNFGHYFRVENDLVRIEAIVYFSTDHINGTVDQCNPSYHEILNGGPKCDPATTKCLAVPESGFLIGGYRCVCRDGFHVAETSGDGSTNGHAIEKEYLSRNFTHFRCLSCLDSCMGVCSTHELCAFQRSYLLRNSILVIQVICVVTTSALTIVVFKHRKCKTIATGMWTIMEMILLGSIILYGTIIIRAFNPSTVICLIEPWCREIGFVLCYGAIILKLYRILIEFRTRKAHRWVIRDKDLLKYLLGMVIVVFGYMAAWTATNLDHIRKENYSILTTGTTADGTPFKACKAAWWDYVTQTGEILILVFGIHLSYASRNATTQFRERCFLCISITTEAFISGAFYVLRYFYWETEVHPDTSFVANFVRCQLTTTVVLLLLFAPKWWYQKVQVNKGRVSRHYLTQESGRGPLEAFKPQDGVTATNSDVEGEISLADMNPEDIRIELKRLYTQLEVLKNKTIRFDNPHISKRRGGRKIAHRRFSLQTLRQQTHRLSSRHTDVEVTEAEASRTPEDSVCSVEGPSIVINDGTTGETTPRKNQK